MQYVNLGKTGLKVSRLCLGMMTYGSKNWRDWVLEEKEARPFVKHALDAGINFFDTADVYSIGESEKVTGNLLKDIKRENIVVATKVYQQMSDDPNDRGLSRKHILWSIDQSLGRLGTSHVDAYIVHRVDPEVPLAETLAALDEVVRAGKARSIGYSNWPAWLVAAAIGLQRANGWAEFSHGQMYYSLLGRDVERDTAAMMRHFGLGLSVWSPLAYGFLAGGYTAEDMAKDDNRFGKTDWLRFDRARAFALLPLLHDMAASKDCSMARLALAWLLARDAVSTVLLGATKPHQLADNLGAADVVLADAELAQLDAATACPPHYPSSDWVEAMLPGRKKP